MFSRIRLHAKGYYNAQAELAYVDSVFENSANSEDPTALNNDLWMARAEKAKSEMSNKMAEIVKLGGVIKDGRIYDGQGEPIRNHTMWAA